MKYAVKQKFWDTGAVSVESIEVSDTQEDISEKRDSHDFSLDVFDTKEEQLLFTRRINHENR